MKIKGLPYNFIVIDTIGDGNCFLHAILGGCNSLYDTKNEEGKKILVRQLRLDLAQLLDININNTTFYQKLSRGQLEEISKHIKEVNKEYMQAYLKSNHWLNSTFLEFFSMVFGINIIIISSKEKDIYRTGDKELLFKKRNTIFINYIDQCHFETLGVQTKDGLKTIFHYDSKIIKTLNKLF